MDCRRRLVLCSVLLVLCCEPARDALSTPAEAVSKDLDLTLPLRIQSSAVDQQVDGQVEGHLDFPWAGVRSALSDPATWCAIIALHQNVKACVHEQHGAAPLLRVYYGSKNFEDANHAVRSDYVFVSELVDGASLRVTLSAAQGPFGTRDHHIALVAEADPRGGTTFDFRYRYQLSRLAQGSLRFYLATGGRDKIGFTVVGQTAQGMPIYIDGARGLIERNAVRYYLAMIAYLDSRTLTSAGSDEWRAGHWYDLTQRYAAQLYELERGDYLANKRREFAQQNALQANIDRSAETSQVP